MEEREDINTLIRSIMKELKIKMPHIAIPHLRVLVTGEKHTPSIDACDLRTLWKERVRGKLEEGLTNWINHTK